MQVGKYRGLSLLSDKNQVLATNRYFLNKLYIVIQGCPYSTHPSGNCITFDRDARSFNDIPRVKRQFKQIFSIEQYTSRERSEIVEIYIQQNKSILKTQLAFKKLKNVKSAPSKNTIKRLYEKFSTGEALSNPKRPNKSRPRRSAENIAAV